MLKKLPNRWVEHITALDVAFQPILNIHTGEIYGVEALLRNYEDIGFKTIFSVFDKAFDDGILYEFDLIMREKAFIKYKSISNYKNIKIFYNLDNRLFEIESHKDGNTKKILKKLNIAKNNLVFEISERHQVSSLKDMELVLKHYNSEKYSIAIDDFGVGHSGYKLLYESTPNIIKIDRYFLKDIEIDLKKKLLVRNMIHLAIQLGIRVVAEGVETKREFLVCKEIGCHLAQGYLIQKPTQDTDEILQEYKHIVEIIKKDKRQNKTNKKIESFLEEIPPICIDTKMNLVVEHFKKNKINQVIPIIDTNNEPLGILHEGKIKEFLYSPYGISLLSNDDSKKTKLKHLMDDCGSADINSDISTIIELFSNNPESSGIIITKKLKYYGFLSARAIINIMNEESLLLARDQNPLTRLPGNNVIEKYILECSKDNNNHILCYFDLDNFKAFNDVCGFRNGDRIIQLFADILRKHLPKNFFKAHIGGDDFFSATKDIEIKNNIEDYIKSINNIINKFEESAKEFYSQKDKDREYIISKDREGNEKKFPLLTVSASILEIKETSSYRSIEEINKILATQKKVAKNDTNHISFSTLL